MKKILSLALLCLWAGLALAANPVVTIKTSKGDIVVELDAERAPATTANFMKYVKDGFYTGTIFHRVISNFMIQGGGFTADMNQKSTPYPPLQNEAPASTKAGLSNVRGSIAMARTGNPHSATAQFFINVQDNSNLDYPSFDGWGYAVFGKVVKGMDVVDQIRSVPTGQKGPMGDVPVQPVVINAISLDAAAGEPAPAKSKKK